MKTSWGDRIVQNRKIAPPVIAILLTFTLAVFQQCSVESSDSGGINLSSGGSSPNPTGPFRPTIRLDPTTRSMTMPIAAFDVTGTCDVGSYSTYRFEVSYQENNSTSSSVLGVRTTCTSSRFTLSVNAPALRVRQNFNGTISIRIVASRTAGDVEGLPSTMTLTWPGVTTGTTTSGTTTGGTTTTSGTTTGGTTTSGTTTGGTTTTSGTTTGGTTTTSGTTTGGTTTTSGTTTGGTTGSCPPTHTCQNASTFCGRPSDNGYWDNTGGCSPTNCPSGTRCHDCTASGIPRGPRGPEKVNNGGECSNYAEKQSSGFCQGGYSCNELGYPGGVFNMTWSCPSCPGGTSGSHSSYGCGEIPTDAVGGVCPDLSDPCRSQLTDQYCSNTCVAQDFENNCMCYGTATPTCPSADQVACGQTIRNSCGVACGGTGTKPGGAQNCNQDSDCGLPTVGDCGGSATCGDTTYYCRNVDSCGGKQCETTSCNAGCGPVCGNGSCESGENSWEGSPCPQDCGY